MADIFISYKREEAEQAARLAHVLEQFGYSVWWDVALLSGDEYRDVIAQMIDNCLAVVVLWSPLAVKSTFVRSEASYAQRQDKLLPAMLEACHLPLGFDESHMDDLSGWKGEVLHPGLQRLLNSVQNKTGKPAIMGAAPAQSASQKAEILAFQAAAKMNSHGAWAQFLKDHPATIFRDFIAVKMSELAPAPAPAPPPTPSPTPTPTPAPVAAPPPPPTPAPRPDVASPAPEPARFLGQQSQSASTDTPETGNSALKMLVAVIAVLVIGGVGLLVFSNVQKQADTADWQTASAANTVAAYSAYLDDHPKGDFIYTARKRLTELKAAAADAESASKAAAAEAEQAAAQAEADSWAKAQKLDTYGAYDDYLAAYPAGAHATNARTRQREIDAAQTRAAQDAEAKRLASEKADADRKAKEAADLAQRKADDNAWSIAKSADTKSAYNSYLAAYRSGRHATEARAAIKRLDTPAPYSLDQLHPDVRKVVEAARRAETLAQSRAALARDAARKADEAAARARAGAAGTNVSTYTTFRYETEFSNGARNGYGVRTATAGDFIGDVYRGQWSSGQRSGLGVYAYANNPNNTNANLRYEGDWTNSKANGQGVNALKSGETHAGAWSDGLSSGPGVYRFASGLRYEGDFAAGKSNGLGVYWSSSGQVLGAGRWKDDTLVEPLAR